MYSWVQCTIDLRSHTYIHDKCHARVKMYVYTCRKKVDSSLDHGAYNTNLYQTRLHTISQCQVNTYNDHHVLVQPQCSYNLYTHVTKISS